MPLRFPWLGRAVILVASLLFVVAIGEGLARWRSWRIEESERAVRARWQAEHPAAADLPELSGVVALAEPNARGIYKGVLVRTDAQGFRGRRFTRNAAPGVVRIVVTGDSYTFGDGVAEEDTYASQLGGLLDGARPGVRHQVVNAGLSGAPIETVMDRLERAIHAYHPGLFVYGFSLNDLEGEGYVMLDDEIRRRQWIAWAGRQPLLLVRLLTWQIVTAGIAASPAEAPYPRELRRNYFENDQTWSRFERGLDRYAALARESGVCAHMLIHTLLVNLDDEHPFHPIYDRVSDAARARGITVTSSFPVFEGRDPESLWINPLDSHPDAEGHALLAGALAEDLVHLPEHCWTEASRKSATHARRHRVPRNR